MVENATMFWLAENYKIGIGVATGVAVLVYVGISLLMFFKARKFGKDVSVCAMIPLWHIKYAFLGVSFKPKSKPAKSIKPKETQGNLE